MAVVALVVHHDRPEAAKVTLDLSDRLLGAGHQVRVPAEDAERTPLYEEVADLEVHVQPYHAAEEKPKRAIAEDLADHVRAWDADPWNGGS